MPKKNIEKMYQNINELFFELIKNLEQCHFDFCAYVVKEAYRFYDTELEKRFENNVN